MIRFLISLTLFLVTTVTSSAQTIPATISEGKQPQISVDTRGVIRVVFGREDQIFCATSSDKGVSFSKPVLVAQLPDMHLGMTRGPQLASSNRYSVITAMDKSGNIHTYRLTHSSGKWQKLNTVNDQKKSAPEGLMSIAADKKDNFYAVWLDTRLGNKNQICFSSLTSEATNWSKNRIVYESPSGHVCECCKPSITSGPSGLAIMFRNWFFGSRDLYMLHSKDNGKTFAAAKKLGEGTWRLNACPMDGGGMAIDASNTVHTAWQRAGSVFYCQPGKKELQIGNGKSVSIVSLPNSPVILLQEDGSVKSIRLKDRKETVLGKGNFLKAVALPGNNILCVWERDNEITYIKM